MNDNYTAQLIAERDAAEACLAAVAKLHVDEELDLIGDETSCRECGVGLPCPTLRALAAPVSPQPEPPTEPATEEPKMTGAELITAERQRQIDAEGWTPEHDAEHHGEALAHAAAVYATPAALRGMTFHVNHGYKYELPTMWPWARDDFKPTPDDRVRELVKAGALIAAEIDRLQRPGPLSEEGR